MMPPVSGLALRERPLFAGPRGWPKGRGDGALEMGIGTGSPRTHPHRRGVFGEATLGHRARRAHLLATPSLDTWLKALA